MPVLVQQNTPQGVQLILRPPQPQLTTQGLVIHNTRTPQMQQQPQQQLLRILNTNGGMQLTSAAPTFIVSSQANLIQQNLQNIKAHQASPTITQLQSINSQQPQLAAIGNQIIGRSMVQNLQLNGNLAHIQMQNGMNGPFISQLPAHFQQQLANFNPNINFNQLSSANFQQLAAAAAAAASGATFQSPPPSQDGAMVVTGQNIQFTTTQQQPQPQQASMNVSLAQSVPSSPIMTHPPQLLQSVTPEPMRQPTPITLPPNTVVIQDTKPHQQMQQRVEPEIIQKTPKKPKKPKVKKQPIPVVTPAPQVPRPSPSSTPISNYSSSTTTSSGKLDLANVMKLCGIMEDDEFMDADEPLLQVAPQPPHQPQPHAQEMIDASVVQPIAPCSDIMVTIPYSHNSDVPFSFTIPTTTSEATTAKTITSKTTTSLPSVPIVTSVDGAFKSGDQQFMIKIDNNDVGSAGGYPLTISIPRMTEETSPTKPVASVSTVSSTTPMCVPTFVNNVLNSTVTPTLQSQINEIQNQLMGVGGATSEPGTVTTHSNMTTTSAVTPVTPQMHHVHPQPQTNTSGTASLITPQQQHQPVVAPKATKKRPAKKNGKKIDTIATSVGHVPSQIGNIQISQVDSSKTTVAGNKQPTIENQIQITPIIDSKQVGQQQQIPQQSVIPQGQTNQMPQQQQLQNNMQINQTSSAGNQQLTASSSQPQTDIAQMQQQHIQSPIAQNIQQQQPLNAAQQHQIQVTQPGMQLQMIQQQPQQHAQTVPQLTGSLCLSLVEDGRLILRHNPNERQDAQSQMILQAILSGALCNVTLINEPLIEKPQQPAPQQQQQPVQPSQAPAKLNNVVTSSASMPRMSTTVTSTVNKNVVVSFTEFPNLKFVSLFELCSQ